MNNCLYSCSSISLIVLAVESFLTPSSEKYPEHLNGQGENTSAAPCWQTEDYFVKQHCAPCSEFEKVIFFSFFSEKIFLSL